MIERGEHRRFASETCDAIWIERHCLRQDFQRNVTLQLQVPRTVDDAHAAGADNLDKFVRTEATPMWKCEWLGEKTLALSKERFDSASQFLVVAAGIRQVRIAVGADACESNVIDRRNLSPSLRWHLRDWHHLLAGTRCFSSSTQLSTNLI